MISPKDVITIKIPYPSLHSGLAMKSHMYICHSAQDNKYEFIKCQSIKPEMLIHYKGSRYIDEAPNVSRNPFTRPTRIDCERIFSTLNVFYDDGLKTTIREDVCDSLFREILDKLNSDEYEVIILDESELTKINALIIFI